MEAVHSHRSLHVEPRVMGLGILGLGTVGCGVVKALRTQAESIAHTGWRPEIKRILVRDIEKPRQVQVDRTLLTHDAQVVVHDPDIQVLIEVIGGIEPARTCITEALLAGKHVITANKELLAKHGDELMTLARRQGVRLLFEASVAGGIPIVHMVEAYLTANRILAIRGILNGTCNYILTKMEEQGLTFAEALYNAQELGYAEADPESDIEGYDAAYKLCILANLAFSQQTPITAVKRSGITTLAPIDLRMAKQFGTALKLIGIARLVDGRPELEVGLRFLAQGDALASVRDVFNAVTLTADVVGDLTFIGRGAGELPTASAVIEDLMEVLRAPNVPVRSAVQSRHDTDRADAPGVIRAPHQDTTRTPLLYVRLRVKGNEPTAEHDALQALWREEVRCGFLETHATGAEVCDVIAILQDADAYSAERLAHVVGGKVEFTAPFDAPLPSVRSRVTMMS
ncbi:MAG: homoserine dehydrogenase [Firmicutes bacterium]|nr:homoserine dehydrogenase [Bacillota bacterium]